MCSVFGCFVDNKKVRIVTVWRLQSFRITKPMESFRTTKSHTEKVSM